MRRAIRCLLGVSGVILAQPAPPNRLVQLVETLNLELRRFAGESPQTKGAAVPYTSGDVRETAARRAEALAQLIRKEPRRALDAALPQTTLARLQALAPDLAVHLEEYGDWTGRVQVAYEDAPDFRSGRRVVSLDHAGGALDVFFARSEPRGLATDALLAVSGIRLGSAVAAARASVRDPARTTYCSTAGEQPVAVLVVSFPGQAEPDVTLDQLRDYFFGSSNTSLDGFWRENSYGTTFASGDVFGVFQLDRVYECGETTAMANAAIRAADPTVDFTKYTRLFILFPKPTPACDWAGKGSIGCGIGTTNDGPLNASVTWVAVPKKMSRSYAVEVIAHEGGHNLGLGHSMSRDDGAEALGAPAQPGTLDEYGDPVAMMGSGFGHYAAKHKSQLGWLSDDETVRIQTTGEATLAPLASQASGIKAVKLRRSPDIDGDLWIEYRQPIGSYDSLMFDRQVYTGAVIRYDDAKTVYRDTHLLDFTPQSEEDEYDFMDPALASGKFWFDPYSQRTLYVTVGADGRELRIRAGLEAGCVTLAASGREHGPGDEGGAVAIASSSDCNWQANASAPWITVQPASGSGSAALQYRVAANAGAARRTGAITVGRQVFTITQFGTPAPPVTYGAFPKTGSGPYADLMLGFGDPNGVDDLAVLRASIGPQKNGCSIEYDVAAKSFRLANNAGTGWIGPEREDSFHPLENSQCKVASASSDVYEDELYLFLGVQLKITQKTDLKVLISAVDKGGLEAPWQEAALWTAMPNVKPALAGVVPNNGAGTDLVFHLTVTDGNGGGDVRSAVLRFGTSPKTCEVTVFPGEMVAAMTMDDGSAKTDAFGYDGTLENSQCLLDLADTWTYWSGNELRIRLPLRFKESFSGSQAIAASVTDYSDAVATGELGRWRVGPATLAAPVISAAGVVNGASFAQGAVAPGEIVTIFGAGAGPAELQLSWYEGQNLRAMVGNTEVFFDGTRAPLIYTSSGQVSAVAPYYVRNKTMLRVEYEGRRSNEVELPVANCAPGIFTLAGGAGPAVAVNQDGTLNSADRPAERGSAITFYMTGEGRTQPYLATGRLPSPGKWPAPVEPAKVTFGGVEGQIEFIGLVYAGVTQVNVRVPSSAPGGGVPLVVAIGGASSPAGVTVQLK